MLSSEADDLIDRSNLNKLSNVDAAFTYNIIKSPTLWVMVAALTLTCSLVAWGRLADALSNRHDHSVTNNVRFSSKMAQRLKYTTPATHASPNWAQVFANDFLLFLKICHPLVSIFFTFDPQLSRAFRFVIYFNRFVALLFINVLFYQDPDTAKSFSTIQKMMITIFAIVLVTPVDLILGNLLTDPRSSKTTTPLPPVSKASIVPYGHPITSEADKSKPKQFSSKKRVGLALSLVSICGSLWAIFTIEQQMPESLALDWLQNYIGTFTFDFIGNQTMKCSVNIPLVFLAVKLSSNSLVSSIIRKILHKNVLLLLNLK